MAKYLTQYSIQAPGSSQFLSWAGGKHYVYNDDSALWVMFQDPTGVKTSGDSLLTGDVVWLQTFIVLQNWMYSRGNDGSDVRWAKGASDAAFSWQIWTDTDQTPGQPVSVGDTIYISSADPDAAGFLSPDPDNEGYYVVSQTKSGFKLASYG